MPNLDNAKKALRQAAKRAERNKVTRDEVHSMRRKFRKLLETGKQDEAKTLLSSLYKKLDKSAKKGIFKQNKVARIKSRATLKLNKASK